eukprot:19647-Heterococcus_DN1.PRE.1
MSAVVLAVTAVALGAISVTSTQPEIQPLIYVFLHAPDDVCESALLHAQQGLRHCSHDITKVLSYNVQHQHLLGQVAAGHVCCATDAIKHKWPGQEVCDFAFRRLNPINCLDNDKTLQQKSAAELHASELCSLGIAGDSPLPVVVGLLCKSYYAQHQHSQAACCYCAQQTIIAVGVSLLSNTSSLTLGIFAGRLRSSAVHSMPERARLLLDR